jgi:nucleoside permease NupC
MVIRSIVGLFAFALIAWVISENRRKVDLRVGGNHEDI